MISDLAQLRWQCIRSMEASQVIVQENVQLKQQIELLQKSHREEKQSLVVKFSSLMKNTIRELRAEMTAINSKVLAGNDLFVTFQSQLKAPIQQLTSKLNKSQQENCESLKMIQSLLKELESLKVKLSSTEASFHHELKNRDHIEALKSANLALEEKLNEANNNKAALEAKIKMLKSDVEAYEDTNEMLRKKISTLTDQVEDMRNQGIMNSDEAKRKQEKLCADYEYTIQLYIADNQRLNERIRVLVVENEKLQTALNATKVNKSQFSKFVEMKNENAELQSQIVKLTHQLNGDIPKSQLVKSGNKRISKYREESKTLSNIKTSPRGSQQQQQPQQQVKPSSASESRNEGGSITIQKNINNMMNRNPFEREESTNGTFDVDSDFLTTDVASTFRPIPPKSRGGQISPRHANMHSGNGLNRFPALGANQLENDVKPNLMKVFRVDEVIPLEHQQREGGDYQFKPMSPSHVQASQQQYTRDDHVTMRDMNSLSNGLAVKYKEMTFSNEFGDSFDDLVTPVRHVANQKAEESYSSLLSSGIVKSRPVSSQLSSSKLSGSNNSNNSAIRGSDSKNEILDVLTILTQQAHSPAK